MKKIVKYLAISCLLIVVCLSVSSCNQYNDGKKLIEFITTNGELQNDGQYKIDLKVSDDKSNFNYILYNPADYTIGVAHVYKLTFWSEAAREIIITQYVEEYVYFAPGKPWDVTAFHYDYFIDSQTLEKTTAKYNFKMDRKAFDRNTHKIVRDMSYIKDVVLIDGIERRDMKNNVGYYLYEAFEKCVNQHILTSMPYIF